MQESLSASTSAASAAAESAAAALPEPVRGALSSIKGPLSEALSQVRPVCSRTGQNGGKWSRSSVI